MLCLVKKKKKTIKEGDFYINLHLSLIKYVADNFSSILKLLKYTNNINIISLIDILKRKSFLNFYFKVFLFNLDFILTSVIF